tara:strand:- start:1766 stop:1870 length:105 start_codon:yes stop_codon:yes gene_type:complete
MIDFDYYCFKADLKADNNFYHAEKGINEQLENLI